MNDELIEDWLAAKTDLADAKRREARLREQVVREHFNNVLPGTNYVRGDAGVLKATVVTRYAVSPTLPDYMKSNRLFRERLELDKREYDRLDPEFRREVDEYITSKHGVPRVEFVRMEDWE